MAVGGVRKIGLLSDGILEILETETRKRPSVSSFRRPVEIHRITFQRMFASLGRSHKGLPNFEKLGWEGSNESFWSLELIDTYAEYQSTLTVTVNSNSEATVS